MADDGDRWTLEVEFDPVEMLDANDLLTWPAGEAADFARVVRNRWDMLDDDDDGLTVTETTVTATCGRLIHFEELFGSLVWHYVPRKVTLTRNEER